MFEFEIGDRVRLNDANPIFEQYISNLIDAEVAYVDKHNLRIESITSKTCRSDMLLYIHEEEGSSYDFYPNKLIKRDLKAIAGLILGNQGFSYTDSNFEILKEEEFEKHKHLIGLPILIPAIQSNQKQRFEHFKKLPIL